MTNQMSPSLQPQDTAVERSTIAAIAEEVALEQYRSTPAFARYGESGKRYASADSLFHIESLVNATQLNSKLLFVEYVLWCEKLFRCLRLPKGTMWGYLELLSKILPKHISPDLFERFVAIIGEANSALKAYPEVSGTDNPPSSQVAALQQLLLEGNLPQAVELTRRNRSEGMSLRELYRDVFAASQRRLGELWMQRSITPAQEHLCSAATQTIMSQFFTEIVSTPRIGLKGVAACPAGELHEMGPRMLADIFQLAGWDMQFLGADVPTSGVMDLIRSFRPDLLLVSVTMLRNVPSLISLVNAIKAEFPQSPKILVGGYPFSVDPHLWEMTRADGWAPDFDSAVTRALELCGLPKGEEK